MAENNNRNPLGHNINYNDASNPDSGLGGYFIGNSARNEFSNKFWDDQNGYLAVVKSELEKMLSQYKEISSYTDKMSAATRRNITERNRQLEQELEQLKAIKKQQDVSSDVARDSIKNATAVLTKAQEGVVKGWVDLQNKVDDAADKIESSTKHYGQLKNDFSKMNKEVANYVKTAEKASDSFSSALSKTLKDAGDRLANLTNMFSLQKIANNTAEQNARSIEKIQSDTMKQFGFTSNSQFYNFADSLNGTLKEMNKSMGSLFGNDDLKTYLGNLSEFGITSTAMAEQQMKNSIIATKYLGVSNETQTMMFKYMKRTNNTEMLEKHNQTIVGLLKSELGVSKEQLDALAQIAYGSVEDKAALGMSKEAIDAQDQAMLEVSAILSNMYGDNAAKEFENAINDFVLNPADDKWIKTFGGNYMSTYDSLFNSKTTEEQMKAMEDFIRGIENSNLLNAVDTSGSTGGFNSAYINKQTQSMTGVSSELKNMAVGFDWNRYGDLSKNVSEIVKNTKNSDVENYVEKSTEATLLEKIENWLSTNLGVVAWKLYGGLAIAAFSAYLASDVISFFKSAKEAGGIGKLFSKFLGKGSIMADGSEQMSLFANGGGKAGSALGGLMTGAAIVGLTAAAISGIAHSSRNGMDNSYNKGVDEMNNAYAEEYGSTNAAVSSAYGVTKGTESQTWLGKQVGNLATGTKKFTTMVTSNDQTSNNKALINWMYESGVLEKYWHVLALQYMLDSVHNLDAYNQAFSANVTHEDLKNAIKDGHVDKATIDRYAQGLIDAGWQPRTDSNGGKMKSFSLNLDGYKKNGLYWVPKDNYKALLHKGEMVLTEKQADAYRSMNEGVGGEAEDKALVGFIKSPWTRVTSMWGSRKNPFGGGGMENHGGIDIGAPRGTPVGSPVSGRVHQVTEGYESSGGNSSGGGFGNSVYITGKDGFNYILAHFVQKASVNSGDSVSPGQLVGYVGSTGRSTGPHLHFQVNKTGTWTKGEGNSNTVDPVPHLNSGVLYPGDGNIVGLDISSTTGSAVSSSNGTSIVSNTVPVKTTAFIPKAFRSDVGMGGEADRTEATSRIVNNGIDRLIGYLDNIRTEQNDQRKILEAFSRSRVSESAY